MGIPEPYVPKPERPDPTEWRPRYNSGWERVNANAEPRKGEEVLRYVSLAGKTPEEVAAIEATAMANVRQKANAIGLSPDERSLRGEWQFHATVYAYPMPEGFVHPEAPADVKREGREAWSRAVQGASDGLLKTIFTVVWRRRAKAIERGTPQLPAQRRSEITATDDGE